MSETMHRCDGCETLFSEDQLVTIDGKRLCAQCKMGFVADVRSGLSGSGVELAGIGHRFVAIFLDGLILLIPMGVIIFGGAMVVGMMMSESGSEAKEPGFLFGILIGLVAAVIPIVYEALMIIQRGQTIGKRVMKVKVVMADGSRVTKTAAWKRSAFRNILSAISNGVLSLIECLFAFGKSRKALHDRVAGTIVIKAG